MKISVIVPVYNTSKYLRKCLDSILNQTLKEIEIIVVDDGSTDDSYSILEEYKEKYSNRIILIQKENGGQGSARNMGLEIAKGEYIGYVDSDDYIREDMYYELYNKAIKENLDIAIGGNYVVDDNYNIIKTELNNYVLEDNKENAFFGKMGVWNKIYKKSLIKNMNFRSKLWYEDLDFTVNAIIKAKKIGYVDLPLYYYLLRKGSTMNNSNVVRNLEILDAFNEIKDEKKYHDYIEFLAIDNILISTIVRVINANANRALKRDIINKLIQYMLNIFKNYKHNPYISSLPKNRKIIYYLVHLKLYWMIRLIFKIKSLGKE